MEEWRIKAVKNAVIRKLKTRVGKAQAFPSRSLTNWLNANGFPDVNHRALRDMIRELRQEGVPICSAAGKGYFWPASIDDVIASRQMLESMAKDLHFTGKQMYEGAIRMFGEQRGLGI